MKATQMQTSSVPFQEARMFTAPWFPMGTQSVCDSTPIVPCLIEPWLSADNHQKGVYDASYGSSQFTQDAAVPELDHNTKYMNSDSNWNTENAQSNYCCNDPDSLADLSLAQLLAQNAEPKPSSESYSLHADIEMLPISCPSALQPLPVLYQNQSSIIFYIKKEDVDDIHHPTSSTDSTQLPPLVVPAPELVEQVVNEEEQPDDDMDETISDDAESDEEDEEDEEDDDDEDARKRTRSKKLPPPPPPEETDTLTAKFLDENGYFDMPIKAASMETGIGVTSLKKICRISGITRWPYRHRQSMKTTIQKAMGYFEDFEGDTKDRALQTLRAALENPEDERLNIIVKKARQFFFKIENKHRQAKGRRRQSLSGAAENNKQRLRRTAEQLADEINNA